MEFLRNIFLSIAAFFGGGTGDVPVEPAVSEVVVEESVSIVIEEDPAADSMSDESKDDMSASSTEANIESNAEPEPEQEAITETNIESTMSGNAAPIPASSPAPVATPDIQTMLVAGGCFWCTESDLEKTPGVISAVSGYAGGTSESPTYDNYGSGGHREVVEVTYDANQVSFEDILIVTMKTTDPTDDDGTFADRGDKYSSAFYYETSEQKDIIDSLIKEVDENGPYDAPLAIDVESRPQFWPAEDFHQDYYKGSLIQQAKYKGYRAASGRDRFIETYWSGNDIHSGDLPWRTESSGGGSTYFWEDYVKPSSDVLQSQLDSLAYRVTQQDGTERSGTHEYDKLWDDGIYVDILSGEPLYSSRDKYDSGTGWPSFVKPITDDALTLHEDRKLLSLRTETRSAIADNHLGHVFTDGPADRGGLRYCMNGVALKFIPKNQMEALGYGDFLQYL